jgi:methylated-DNA-[protein]-cysteine S-methyltransferase
VKYRTVKTLFGKIGIVWSSIQGTTKIVRVLLPRAMIREHAILTLYPDAKEGTAQVIERVAQQFKDYFAGTRISFSLQVVDLTRLYGFQKKVLMAERKIPYGWVCTYGRLAEIIGNPGAARAVGTALARNPFPLIIPCHRTIRSDGSLGGYGGGKALKRQLLELEGVAFGKTGKVTLASVW